MLAWTKLPLKTEKRKPTAAERLLHTREAAGADPEKHERYHKMVNRYQRKILKAYYLRKRFPFVRWFVR